MRKKIVIGNWKMNFTLDKSISFATELKKLTRDIDKVDIAVCPTFVALKDVKDTLKDSYVKVGAQNVHFEDSGAYTGEVSADMLKNIGMDYCIIGHSERRQYFNETDAGVNKKTKKLLDSDIIPVICIGENKEQRENKVHFEIVKKQIELALDGVSKENITKCIIAYEPIWAIGTGVTATNEEAEEMCRYIREVISNIYDLDVALKVRILYGGSVNKENASGLLNQPNIDGGLIGGASLKLDFIDIIKSV